jgi:hypothetical protein
VNEVTVDPAEKISLWSRKHKEHAKYVMEESDDGVITLTPLTQDRAKKHLPSPVEPEPEMA